MIFSIARCKSIAYVSHHTLYEWAIKDNYHLISFNAKVLFFMWDFLWKRKQMLLPWLSSKKVDLKIAEQNKTALTRHRKRIETSTKLQNSYNWKSEWGDLSWNKQWAKLYLMFTLIIVNEIFNWSHFLQFLKEFSHTKVLQFRSMVKTIYVISNMNSWIFV